MTIEEYEKKCNEKFDEIGTGLRMTNEELVKSFVSHIVISDNAREVFEKDMKKYKHKH